MNRPPSGLLQINNHIDFLSDRIVVQAFFGCNRFHLRENTGARPVLLCAGQERDESAGALAPGKGRGGEPRTNARGIRRVLPLEVSGSRFR
jgi:hypothetical protein